MMTEQLYLAIDQGGTSSRAMVCRASGEALAVHQTSVTTVRDGARVEQNADELLASVRHCIQGCLQQLSQAQRLQIQSAALVTQRSSFVAVERHSGRALTPVLSWQDTRAERLLQHLMPDTHECQLLTGLRASGHYGASKMAWCLRHNAEVQQAQQRGELMFLPLASYLAAALTGSTRYYVDPANASRTLLMDINTLSWHEKLLDAFAIERQCLPEIKPTLFHYGTLALDDLEIPLAYLNGDQSAALFGCGRSNERRVYVNIGTGAFVSRFVDNHNPQTLQAALHHRLLRSIVHVDQQQRLFVLEGTVNGAGVALSEMAKQLAYELTLSEVAPELDAIPIFINTIGGLAAPFWRTDIESQFIGGGDAAQKMLAVMESICFLITNLINLMSKVSPALTAIQISGGLANDSALCQTLADVTGLTVIRADDVEASALGGVWWLAGQPDTWLSGREQHQCRPRENGALLRRYQLWQMAMARLTQAQPEVHSA